MSSVILELDNSDYFKYVSSITNDVRCTRGTTSRIAIAMSAFYNEKAFFTCKLDLNLRKKLAKCYIWSIAFYGAATWTLRKVDHKYLGSFEMWCWRRMDRVSCTELVRNVV